MALNLVMRRWVIAGGLGVGLALAAGCDTSSVLPEAVVETSPWQVINPRPFAVEITAMWGDAPDHVLAVGTGGAVLVKEGPAWREAPRPTNGDFIDLHGCDWQHIYALNVEGVFFFNGHGWTRTGPGPLDRFDRIWCRAPDDVLLVGYRGVSHHFDGRTWTQQDLPVAPEFGAGHWLTGTADGYHAIGRDGYAAQWRQGRWEAPLRIDNRVYSVYAICRAADPGGPERILAAADNSRIYGFTRDQGWERLTSLDIPIRDMVSGGSGQAAYILGRTWDGNAAVCTLTGDTLGTVAGMDQGALVALRSANADAGDHLIFGGRYGTIVEGSGDGGGLVRIAGGAPATVGTFLVWPDGGFTGFNRYDAVLLQGSRDGVLILLPREHVDELAAVWGPAQDRLYGVGAHGRVVLLRPGQEPQTLAPAGDEWLTSVWGTDDGELWVGGRDMVWRGDGSSWEPLDFPFVGNIDRILGHGRDDVYLFEQSRVLHWDGQAVSVLHEGSYVYEETAVPAPDGRGIFCAVEPRAGGQFLFPALRRLAPGGGASYVVFPGSPRGLVALDDGSFLTATNKGLFRLESGAWIGVPHPATDSGGYIECLGGSREAGIYTFSSNDVIHHLDSGGSGLWP